MEPVIRNGVYKCIPDNWLLVDATPIDQTFIIYLALSLFSLSSDIYTLKNVLLEGFVLFEEASSRERRRNDHSYITMLKERALDPITARHMQKINQRYQYLNTQLQEVNNKLDQDWILHMSNKKKSSNFHISSTEAIYKTIVNNQKIIHNLRKKVDALLERAEEKKLKNITNSGSWMRHHKRLLQEDLSKLADEFLQVKITHKDEGEHTLTKKLSPDSQNFLRDFLRKSSVVNVRPTAVYSPSQSRLLSNTIPSDDNSEPDQTQVSSPKIVSVVSVKEMNDSSMSVNEASVVPRHLNESTPVNSYFPIYEPITPPETATTAPEPVNKTYTCLLREKEPEPLSCPASISTVLTSDQGVSSSLLSSVKNKKELPKFSFVPEMKSTVFNQSTSEAIPSFSSVFCTSNLSIVNNSGFTQLKPLDAPVDSTKLSTSESVISTLPSLTNATISVVTCSVTITSQSNLSICKPSSSPLVTLPLQSTSLSSTMKFGQIVSTTSLDSSKTNKSDAATLEVKQKQMIGQSQSESLPFFSSSKIVASTSSETPVTQTSFGQQSPSSTVPQMTLFGQSTSTSVTQAVSGQPTSTTVMQTNFFGQPLSTATAQTVSTASVSSSEIYKPLISSTSSFDVKPAQAVGQSQSGTLPLFPSPKTNVSTSNETSVTQTVFGQQSTSTTVPQVTLSNQSTTTSVTPTTVSGQSTPTAVTQTTVSGQSTPTTVVQTTVFGQSTPTTVTPSTVFGQSTPTTVTQTTVFGQSTPTTGTEAPVFNQSTPSTIAPINLFSQTPSTAVTQTALFGQPTSTSVTQTLFGQPTSTSNFTSTSGGFFSQTPTLGAPDNTSAVTTTTASSDFNNQSSFSFGKPAFGQTTGSFGLAKSLFGQNTNSFTPSSTPSSFSFNQNQGSGFGQGSFFSGLGGKPSEENASKNVFGISSGVKSPDTNNLFKNSSVKSFGAVNGNTFSGTGSFSSGGGSVAQSGFGSFQQTPTQQSVGAFGASPTFGGNPAFGSPPAFGGSPGFGSGNSLSPVFGQQQVSSNFSNFANASSPTFGSLATQGTGFGSSPGFGSPTFGSAPAFGTSSFGGQSPGFGNPSSPPSNSSAFTQWRN